MSEVYGIRAYTGLGASGAPAWGAQRAAAENVAYKQKPYPAGAAGVRMSLEEMARLMREGRQDKDVCGYAADVLKAAGLDGRNRDTWTVANIVQTLLNNVRSVTIYSPDPSGTEMITSAAGQLCLRPGLCIRKEDCLPEGTLLLRDDYELVPIEQIKVGDRIWGKDEWTRVEATAFKGKLKVDAVELNTSSTMYLTGDHKVYVGVCVHGHRKCNNCHGEGLSHSFERIPVTDLKPGYVLLRPDRIAFGKQSLDPDRMYVEGLYLSEGWNNGDRFSISGQDGYRKEALKHEVKAICERLSISTYWNRKYIRVNDAAWAHQLAKRGTRARFKNAETLDLDEAAAAALLRGIMSDSTSSGKRARGRTFNTTSRKLALQTRILQRMFGVSMSCKMMTPEEHGGEGQHPLWRMGTRARTENSSQSERTLRVRSVARKVCKLPCWDIQTEDHYVYLPEHDVTVSNCDGLTVLLGSLCMCVGLNVRIVKQSWGAGQQQHVLLAVQDENSRWLKADPSHASLPVGQGVPAVEEEMYDPLDSVGAIGTSGAELVTFGSLPPVNRVALGPMRPRAQVNDQLTPRRGLGAASTAYAQSTTDIAAMASSISAADTYLAASEYANAVTAYQAAGDAGAQVIGPEIDLAGAPNVTQPFTQQAWQINAKLAALSAPGATLPSATAAQSYAKQMLAIYQNAVASGTSALQTSSTPGGGPSGGPQLSPNSTLYTTLGIGIVAGAALEFLWLRPRRNVGRR